MPSSGGGQHFHLGCHRFQIEMETASTASTASRVQICSAFNSFLVPFFQMQHSNDVPRESFFKLLRYSGQELWSPKAGGVFQTKAPSLDFWLYLALVLMASMSKSVACSHPGSSKSGKHPGSWCRLLIAPWRCQSVRTRRSNLTEMHG
jgi:hypothetical protein